MALFFLFLLVFSLIFLFYYELIWKRIERDRGKNLFLMGKELMFDEKASPEAVIPQAAAEGPWGDWKYRLTVELYRRGQLYPQEAATLVGISPAEAEEYLDELEGEGKVEQAGDAKRGIFYKVAQEA